MKLYMIPPSGPIFLFLFDWYSLRGNIKNPLRKRSGQAASLETKYALKTELLVIQIMFPNHCIEILKDFL